MYFWCPNMPSIVSLFSLYCIQVCSSDNSFVVRIHSYAHAGSSPHVRRDSSVSFLMMQSLGLASMMAICDGDIMSKK